MTLVGVDGCAAGWICVALESSITAFMVPSISALLTQVERPAIIAIDIPIGLTDSGPRLCDLAARRLLGRPRGTSVFPAPVRAALPGLTHKEASVSYKQRPDSGFHVVVKSAVTLASLSALVRREIQAIDASRPITDVRTLATVVSESVGTRRLALQLVSGFAVLGLLLAATGVYGVVNYAVQQRSREFGIRLALGAPTGSVTRLVLQQGLGLAMIGLALGLGGSLALAGVIRAQLWGVEPTDPLTLASVSVGLVMICGVACYLPARRATRLDPATVLGVE